MPNLYIFTNQVLASRYGHMQLVYDPDDILNNGDELEIEVQAGTNWSVEPVDTLSAISVTNDTVGYSVELEDHRDASHVWQQLVAARDYFATLTINYNLLSNAQNSNSYIATLAHIVGIGPQYTDMVQRFITEDGHELPGANRNVLFDHVDDDGNPLPPIAVDLVGTGWAEIMQGGNGADRLQGGAGDDTLYGGFQADTLGGDAGHDDLFGGNGHDELHGHDGNDLLNGAGGIDSLFGGAGNDTLLGGGSADSLMGHDDNDRLFGNGGADTMDGGRGDDTVRGQTGNDTITGGAQGNDLLDGGWGHDVISGRSGADTLIGGQGNDALYGGWGADTIYGGAGDDFLGGSRGADLLFGGDDNDVLRGLGANDTLSGGGGNDRLNGGWNDDQHTGGAGADQFVFNGNRDEGTDRITDFQDGIDHISVFGITFSDVGITGAADARITLNGMTEIVLEGVAAADIGADDFIFG